MDLTIPRDALVSALTQAAAVAVRHAALPSAAYVVLVARDAVFRLAASDAEIGLTLDLDGLSGYDVTRGGSLAVVAADLLAVVRSLPDNAVRLQSLPGHKFAVTSGRASFRLPGMSTDDIPAGPVFDGEATTTIAAADLVRLIDCTEYAIGTPDRFGLNGAKLEVAGDDSPILRMVATDGHRLSLSEAPISEPLPVSAKELVPKRALLVARKLLADVDCTITLGVSKGYLRVIVPGRTLWLRTLDGEFPDYGAVVPKDDGKTITVPTASLAACVRRVAIVVHGRARAAKFAFKGEAEAEVSVSQDGTEIVEVLPLAGMERDAVEVGFNVDYLADILGSVDADAITVQIAHPLAPALIRPIGDDSTLFVVMPMRLD